MNLQMPAINVNDVAQVAILYFAIYAILKSAKGSRFGQALLGVGVLAALAALFTFVFHFDVLSQIVRWMLMYLALSTVVIFQPEIRRILAAVGAFAECAMNPRKGVYVQGDYGCGKTSLVRAALRRTRIETIPVSLATDWERLDPEEWPYFIDELMRCNVVLDDLGAEPPISCFGVRRELAGEFIVRYHLHGRGRLFVTTNLDGDALLDRYTMRVASRLKDLCIPLILKGGDKRKWLVRGGAE